jgi:hypothetical protein
LALLSCALPALAQEPAEPAAPVAAPPAAATPPVAPSATQSPPRFHRPPPAELYRFSFGLGGALLFNSAPQLAVGGAASAAFEFNPGAVMAPFWRLSLLHAQRRNIEAAAGRAGFAFTLPTLDVCPVRLGPRPVGVRPCVYGSFGSLQVWGSHTAHDETHSTLYGEAGVALSGLVPLGDTFELVADARAGLPFWRDHFALDGASFFQTPWAAFSAGLGLAAGFP